MKKFYLPLAVVALSLAACSRGDLSGYPMTFTTGSITPSTSTRATVNNDWEGVSTVAVQVDGEVKEYTVTTSAGYTDATLSSDDPFYWKRADQTVTVSAWYPYAAEKPDVTVPANQSSYENYVAGDMLEAEQEVRFGGDNCLSFSHRTAKIVVNLSNDRLTNVTVYLVNLSGVEGGGTTVTAYHNGGTQHLALLAPQNIAGGNVFIRLVAGGTTYTYTPSYAITLEGGYAYTFNLSVGDDRFEINGSAIDDWENGGSF